MKTSHSNWNKFEKLHIKSRLPVLDWPYRALTERYSYVTFTLDIECSRPFGPFSLNWVFNLKHFEFKFKHSAFSFKVWTSFMSYKYEKFSGIFKRLKFVLSEMKRSAGQCPMDIQLDFVGTPGRAEASQDTLHIQGNTLANFFAVRSAPEVHRLNRKREGMKKSKGQEHSSATRKI